ncbi:MAG: hypothetical protein NT141_01135 [candidate division WWE3 bacterium]|nr:hypothetical protein [candidate division WWE3 bacterium]
MRDTIDKNANTELLEMLRNLKQLALKIASTEKLKPNKSNPPATIVKNEP